ncbi:D-cysteine desulfhydrase family protein [Thermotoga profunda]|uniref:D-cysteine desulfhydrase family protein n=1 Tax=Thermotoga profunda TaxID=1508420 RepID=UPI00059730CA|nr:D-cysteine desulfhydrase family protein [Thermotoga profunda]
MKLTLAKIPTPIEYLSRLSREYNKEIYVKRDDMTELVSSGNKIRKLEFLLADALRKRCDIVFTCGGIQSNHARATAHLSIKLGLKPVLFLRQPQAMDKNSQVPKVEVKTLKGNEPMGAYNQDNGNLLIDKLLGAELITVTVDQYENIDQVYEEHKKDYERKGLKVYTIPEGGSNSLGAMGYVYAAAEIISQVDLDEFDAIYCAVGSGGTYAGLIAGLRYMGYKTKVIGINVTKTSSQRFVEKIEQIVKGMKDFGIDVRIEKKEIEIIDDFSGPAYAIPTESDLDYIKHVASNEGIILDPVYTAKTFRGMIETSKKGQKILFIHTGGLFGLFAQADKFIWK